MSRTLKDRPYWVRVNDPDSSRRASHDHMVTCREKIGEEPVYREKLDKDGWHWTKELVYNRPIYRLWSETIPCTLEMPEETPSTWRRSYRTPKTDEEFNEKVRNDKHCHYWLNHDGDYVSGKSWKKLTNSALRSKVRQQLQVAKTSHNHWWDDGTWDDVDVFVDSKHAGRGWYDW